MKPEMKTEMFKLQAFGRDWIAFRLFHEDGSPFMALTPGSLAIAVDKKNAIVGNLIWRFPVLFDELDEAHSFVWVQGDGEPVISATDDEHFMPGTWQECLQGAKAAGCQVFVLDGDFSRTGNCNSEAVLPLETQPKKTGTWVFPWRAGVDSYPLPLDAKNIRVWRAHGGEPRIEISEDAKNLALLHLVVYSCDFDNIETCDHCRSKRGDCQ